jgi:4-hydroxy-L-threonine phosphate dehydrogenase PdxA
MICGSVFEPLARQLAAARGLSDIRLAVAANPHSARLGSLGHLDRDTLKTLIGPLTQAVVKGLTE